MPSSKTLTLESFGSEPITVIVGANKKKFFVHESRLRASSDFFNKALAHDFQEKLTRTITLPEVNSGDFLIYVTWLYSGWFSSIEDDRQNEKASSNDNSTPDAKWQDWCTSYELGNLLQDHDFKDALIDVAIENMRTDDTYFFNMDDTIYRYSLSGSPHRQFAVEVALRLWDDTEFGMAAQRAHSTEFLTDLVGSLGIRRKNSIKKASPARFFKLDSGDYDACVFHEHTLKAAPCYKEKWKDLL
ncbi:hypothetical protein N0V83_003641 [Neocucurbitaria cava]|uniref:BTB domain-containing protein n=1 Tax=Neocucurbitaria cava TaxID=798079 RepID=A0A9W8YCL9_9PLEO|nr:hypothetical protein N0V83_003641 [Neocucurbitaria cava]